MNFLQLCQRTRQEIDVRGTGPSAVTGQTGLLQNIVDWVASSWDDLQTAKRNWKWMRVGFTVDTVASDDSYAYTDCTDVLTAAAIARFRRWWPVDDDGRANFKIYKQSDGVGTERWLSYAEWSDFRSIYKIGTQNNGPPAFVTVDPQNNVVLGPAPDAVYVLSGEFQRGNQTLAANSDTPDMPSDFHMVLVYEAMKRYAQFKAAAEVFARAERDGTALRRSLELDQLPRITTAGPLA